MTVNPYAAPTELPSLPPLTDSAGDILANRATRFVAAMLDGFLMMAIVIPYQFVSGFNQKAMSGTLTVTEQLSLSVVQIGALLLLNGYLIITRGQTIGKLVLKIQTVDFRSGQIPPWHRVLLIRQFWLYPLSLLVMLIPGTMDDMAIAIVPLLDVLFIFRNDRRCLHDMLAGTHVVLYRPSRQTIGSTLEA